MVSLARPALGLSLLVWCGLVVLGMKILIDYDKRPGPEGLFKPYWPQETTLYRDPKRPTLVMAMHAGCSCSRASVEELAKIMSKVGPKLTAHILLLPTGIGKRYEEEALRSYIWKRGLETAGTQMHLDPEAREIRAFGALVSGTTLLFDNSGRLVFHGGITASRAHEGDNLGSEFIRNFAMGSTKQDIVGKTPVFGCHLFSSHNQDLHEEEHKSHVF